MVRRRKGVIGRPNWVSDEDEQADDTRLYFGPARDANLLEVSTIVREDGSERAIHAMRMRSKYLPLLEGE
jgi:hypothetical protein